MLPKMNGRRPDPSELPDSGRTRRPLTTATKIFPPREFLPNWIEAKWYHMDWDWENLPSARDLTEFYRQS
jgi:hypothetical protein